MAIFSGEVRSDFLGMDTGINVIMPYDRPSENQQKPCKVLYLLHGLGNNHTSWCRNTNVEKYVSEYGYAVVMPEVQQSFYINMHYGLAYFDYITKELPALIASMFNVSGKREDTFIAGVSMGGYGAVKAAYTYPEKYAACCSFSGALDINYIAAIAKEREMNNYMLGVLGSDKPQQENDLYYLASQLKTDMPTYMCCGTEDYLYNVNIGFKKHLEALGINVSYEEWAGEHEWGFWDKALPKALKFLYNI